MPRSVLAHVILIIVGVVLLGWGVNVSSSIASSAADAAELTQGTRSAMLMVLGSLAGFVGLVGGVRDEH